MAVRVDLNISLDGVAAPADISPENPMGADWGLLVADYTATRTFRERVFGDTSGEGTTGVDDRYAAAYFEGVGAEVTGAGMFGIHSFPDDPDWRGWWGEEPPFRVPVLVLTHRERPPIEFANGTASSSSRPGSRMPCARPPNSPAAPMCASVAASPRCVRPWLRASSTGCTSRFGPSSWETARACGTTSATSTPTTRSRPRSPRAASCT